MENFTKESYNSLFDRIDIINKQYDISSTVRNNFNIFSILHKQHDEVKLHSQFIYSALNDLKDYKVVTYFLEILDLSQYKHFKSVNVYKEHKNIDILLKLTFENNQKLAIIIENKIYANDQDKQLFRYYEHMKEEGYADDEIKIYYLSLYGQDPSEQSVGNLKDIFKLSYNKDDDSPKEENQETTKKDNKKENVFLLSYSYHMIEWCKLCISEFAQEPTVRETFVQYELLLKKLTGQIDTNLTAKIKELILDNDQNVEMTFNILSLKYQIYTELQYGYLENLYEAISKYKSESLSFHITEDTKVTKETILKCYKKIRGYKYYGLGFDVTSSSVPHKTLHAKIEFQGDRFTWGLPINSIDDQTKENIKDICKTNNFPCNNYWLDLHSMDHNFKNMQFQLAHMIKDETLLNEHTNVLLEDMAITFKTILNNLT